MFCVLYWLGCCTLLDIWGSSWGERSLLLEEKGLLISNRANILMQSCAVGWFTPITQFRCSWDCPTRLNWSDSSPTNPNSHLNGKTVLDSFFTTCDQPHSEYHCDAASLSRVQEGRGIKYFWTRSLQGPQILFSLSGPFQFFSSYYQHAWRSSRDVLHFNPFRMNIFFNCESEWLHFVISSTAANFYDTSW